MTPATFEQTALLRKIEAVSLSLDMRARWIAQDSGALVNVPGWETKAEEALETAEASLTRSLHAVKDARTLMVNLRNKHARAAE